jgi:predicted Zn-dependent peptidase
MYKKEELKNRIRLVTSHLKDTQTVTVLVFVRTGSRYETKNISGVSHFLEHMMFKGTEKRKNTLIISEELDSVGAEYNAFTGTEYTGYYVKADYTHLELALDIISDMLINSKFHKKDIKKEKGVVVEEINMYKDNPMRQVAQNLDHLLYGDQPAGWDIAGTKEGVNSFLRKDIVNYFNLQYIAENMVICVAGNFNKGKIKKQVEKYFSKTKTGEPKNMVAVKEEQAVPMLDIEYKKTDQTHLFFAIRSFISNSDQRRFSLAILANVLGGNMSSRLFINVRERQGLSYYISSGSDTSSDTGYFWVRAGADNKRAKEAVLAILKELKKIKQKGITGAELKKAKEYFKGKTLMDLESSDELASFLGAQEVLKKEILSPSEMMKKVNAVSLSGVNDLAREIFQNKNLNLALIGPFKNKEEFKKILKI